MSLTIREVKTKSDRKKFVKLQFELYKNQKNWVPPMISDELHYLDPQTNPAFQYNQAKFFLAERNGKVVGRIGSIINKAYIEKTGINYIRFTKIEFTNDFEVSQALINKVIEIGKENGLDTIHGPLGFSNLDTQGLLIEGFDELQSIASVYHLPYYKEHFDKMGFEKETDWVEFHINLHQEVIDKGTKAAPMLKKRYGFEVKNFTSNKELMPYANEFFEALNEAFSVLPYVTPFNDEMKQFYIKKYFTSVNPKYVKIVLKDNEMAGFTLPVPSLSKAFQKANGKLLPFGVFYILKAMKHNDTADFFLTGVRKKYQNSGVAVLLFGEAQKDLWNNGIKYLETTGIIETNFEVINNWKSFDNVLNKRRRCFVKKIS